MYGLSVHSYCSQALIAVDTSVGGTDPQAERADCSTVQMLLCGGWSLRTGVSLAGLWCQLSLPYRCVFCGVDWVVLQCGLKLVTGYDGLCRFLLQAKISFHLCLAWGHLV